MLPRKSVYKEGATAYVVLIDLGLSIEGRAIDMRVKSGDPIGVKTCIVTSSDSQAATTVSSFCTSGCVKGVDQHSDLFAHLDFRDLNPTKGDASEQCSQEDYKFIATLTIETH